MITAHDGRAEAWSDEQLRAHISNIKQNTKSTLEMASFEALVPTLITYFLQGCSSLSPPNSNWEQNIQT